MHRSRPLLAALLVGLLLSLPGCTSEDSERERRYYEGKRSMDPLPRERKP